MAQVIIIPPAGGGGLPPTFQVDGDGFLLGPGFRSNTLNDSPIVSGVNGSFAPNAQINRLSPDNGAGPWVVDLPNPPSLGQSFYAEIADNGVPGAQLQINGAGNNVEGQPSITIPVAFPGKLWIAWNSLASEWQFFATGFGPYLSPASGYPTGQEGVLRLNGESLAAFADTDVLWDQANGILFTTGDVENEGRTVFDGVETLSVAGPTTIAPNTRRVLCRTSIAAVAVALDDTYPFGALVEVIDADGNAPANNITVTGSTGQTVNGAPSLAIANARESRIFAHVDVAGVPQWVSVAQSQ